MSHTETIAVAMSGGVDSSTVAAILAHGAATTVVGLTLQLWDQTRLAGKHGIPDAPKAGRCCSLDDVYDARRVAEHLGIPYYVVNQEERFEQDVVRPFVERVPRRAHADSLLSLQQPSQVRSVAQDGALASAPAASPPATMP